MRQKIFKSTAFFSVFCVFLHENNTKKHDFNTAEKLRERTTTIVPWEISPKKEGTYPKREFDTERLQKITGRLQILLIDYKRLQRDYKKSEIHYKVY
jgi:hypothetical protein